jgi:hypothetical protein
MGITFSLFSLPARAKFRRGKKRGRERITYGITSRRKWLGKPQARLQRRYGKVAVSGIGDTPRAKFFVVGTAAER